MSTVVVTGASGFIGRKLCAALRPGVRVRAVVRGEGVEGPWDETIRADLAHGDLPRDAFEGTDAVFHFAGKAHAVSERRADDDEYRRINVDGTRRVLEAASRARVARFVFASSVKAMGEGEGTQGSLTPYGQSKLDGEELTRYGGFVSEPVVLRLSLVYGPGAGGNLGAMLRAVAAGRFPPPPRVANRRSMVHVDDVVRASIAAARRSEPVGHALVLGDGVPYSTFSIYAAMRRALGRGASRAPLPRSAWILLAKAGDCAGRVLGRRAPFDSEAYRKLFGSAWYEPSDVKTLLGLADLKTLDDALPAMVAQLRR